MNIEIFDELPSTHLYLKEKILLGDFVPETFILAKHQTQAIGTQGRKWSSPAGDVFAVSFCLEEKNVPQKELLVFFLAFVIQHLLYIEFQIDTKVKWPNDIYLQNKKLAGILVERINNRYLIGIGLNLNQKKFPFELRSTAISLYQFDKKKRKQEEFLNLFIQYFYTEINYWGKTPDYFWNHLQKSWLYQNQRVILFLSTGEEIRGIFQQIDWSGAIIIKRGNKISAFRSGTLRPDF